MNKLCGTRTYLAGAMDRVDDGGVGWRNDIDPFLEEMGVVVLDPCKKEEFMSHAIESVEDRKRRHNNKIAGNYDLIAAEMKEIRNTDLNAVDVVDFLIVNIDTQVHACGTYEEIFWANRMKKPVLVHCEQGKRGLPDWLFGMMPHQLMFSDWMALKSYLVDVNSGKDVRTFKRWTLFDLGKKTLASMLKASEHDSELREMVYQWVNKYA
jgi:nucleoside 2-deoxyribosyltransferase